MKPETADQDELQRMLAMKRQEQPPQKFFKGLSTAVIDRIQNPEPPPPPTLLQRLGLDFDTKAVLVCLSGLAVCALLAFGLIRARDVKPPPPKENAADAQPGPATPLGAKAAAPTRSTDPVMVKEEGDRMNVRPLPVSLPPQK